MPQISSILQAEQQNDGNRIRLYAEGIFYKAYERSAWLFQRVVTEYRVKRQFIKSVGEEVVVHFSLGEKNTNGVPATGVGIAGTARKGIVS